MHISSVAVEPFGFILRRGDQATALFVAAVAFFVYANSLWSGFVWDDGAVIVLNPVLKGDALSLFGKVDTIGDASPYYRPLSILSFLIDYRLHGLNPFIMHFCSVLLHSINAFLVYKIARSLLTDNYSALVAGLLFAVHPISAESVNFLSARNVLLSTAFMLSAYLLHARSTREGAILPAFAGAVCFTVSLYVKETALLLPPFILALEYEGYKRERVLKPQMLAMRLLPYIAGVVCYLVMRTIALENAGAQVEVFNGLGKRLFDNIYIFPHYLLTFVWPPALSNRYYIPENLQLFALPLVTGWFCILAGLGWCLTRGRSRVTFFGLVWFFFFWLPTSGLVSFPSAPLADRYMYVAVIGLWIVLADQLGRLDPRGVFKRKSAVAAGVVVLLALTVSSVVRNLDWRSDVTLFTKYITQFPQQAGGYYALGSAYLEQENDLDNAEKYLEKAFALDPVFPTLRRNMGYIRLKREDYEGALRHFAEALKQKPNDAEVLMNSGFVFEKLQRYEESIDAYRRFLATPGDDFPEMRRTTGMKILILEKWAAASSNTTQGNK